MISIPQGMRNDTPDWGNCHTLRPIRLLSVEELLTLRPYLVKSVPISPAISKIGLSHHHMCHSKNIGLCTSFLSFFCLESISFKTTPFPTITCKHIKNMCYVRRTFFRKTFFWETFVTHGIITAATLDSSKW